MDSYSNLTIQIQQYQHRHPHLVEQHCFSLLEEATKKQDVYHIAFAHTYLADYYMQKRLHAKCLRHLKLAQGIAEEHFFNELLSLCYNIGGIYYHSHFDEVTAVKYYIDAYNLATELQNLDDTMMTLNNIATLFSQKDDFKEALSYVDRAYHIFLKKGGVIVSQRDLVVILNLVQLNVFNGRLPEAQAIYQMYEQQIQDLDKNELSTHIILLCTMYLADAQGDIHRVNQCVDTFLKEEANAHHNKTIYFSFYADIYDVVLKNEDKQRAEHLLQAMGEICLEDDIEQQLTLHLNWIRFAETFHLEESLIHAYKQYYLLQKLVNEHTNRSKSESMKEKILMNHMIKEREQLEQERLQLEAKIKTDELTGLFNRRYFRTLADSMNHNPHVNHLGYIIVDVDYFKEFNDFYGHYQGDILLKSIARCLDEAGDSRFFVARYGGDEFICLCVNVTSVEIEDYLQQVFLALQDLQIEHSASLVSSIATISAGYTIVKMDSFYQYETALVMADTALYKAKQAGRARFLSI